MTVLAEINGISLETQYLTWGPPEGPHLEGAMRKHGIVSLDEPARDDRSPNVLDRLATMDTELAAIKSELRHVPRPDEIAKVCERLAALEAEQKHVPTMLQLQVFKIVAALCAGTLALMRFSSH